MTKTLFEAFLILGSSWVLWVLIGLSILSLAVIFSRWYSIQRQESVGGKLWRDHIKIWMNADKPVDWKAQSESLAAKYPCVESKVIRALAKKNESKSKDRGLLADSVMSQERVDLEKYLGILGTLGSNAPFIGLFGTVLGIIRAFHDLGGNMESAGAQSVTAGLAEALVATAVGLFVAIPSVIFYNYFQRKIKTIMTRADSLASFLIGSGD